MPAPVRIVERGPDGAGRMLALTFDDGPSAWTEPILDHLAAHGARATFFLLGRAIAGREAIVRRAHADGHELGVHTLTHPVLTELADGEIRNELERTRSAIGSIVGTEASSWRPPHLRYDERVAQVAAACGLPLLVGCSIDPADWERGRTPEEIAASVLDALEPGGIVGLHDGRPRADSRSAPTREATVAAVALLLADLGERGYSCVTVSELLAAATTPPPAAPP